MLIDDRVNTNLSDKITNRNHYNNDEDWHMIKPEWSNFIYIVSLMQFPFFLVLKVANQFYLNYF